MDVKKGRERIWKGGEGGGQVRLCGALRGRDSELYSLECGSGRRGLGKAGSLV